MILYPVRGHFSPSGAAEVIRSIAEEFEVYRIRELNVKTHADQSFLNRMCPYERLRRGSEGLPRQG